MNRKAAGFDLGEHQRSITRQLMARDGLTARDLADMIGCSYNAASERIRARWTLSRPQPKFEPAEILAMCDAFGVDPNMFFREAALTVLPPSQGRAAR